jgi:hypothetical protein
MNMGGDMSDGSKLVQWLEQHLKEQQADITLMRLVMQKFLVRIVPSVGAEGHLQDLANDVIGALDRASLDPQNQGAKEVAVLTETRAEQFFCELESMLATAREGRPYARQIVVVSPHLQQL